MLNAPNGDLAAAYDALFSSAEQKSGEADSSDSAGACGEPNLPMKKTGIK